MNIINIPVLVLNQDYQPVNICRVRRAVRLVFDGKAEIVENGRGEIRSIRQTFPIPSVIRLGYLVKHPRRFQKKLTRYEVFNRDKYTCQYCGKEAKELTLDHVIPRFRDGQHIWENVVSCCIPCNRRKGGMTPAEAGMRLLHTPLPPKPSNFYIPHNLLVTYLEWEKFLPGLAHS